MRIKAREKHTTTKALDEFSFDVMAIVSLVESSLLKGEGRQAIEILMLNIAKFDQAGLNLAAQALTKAFRVGSIWVADLPTEFFEYFDVVGE